MPDYEPNRELLQSPDCFQSVFLLRKASSTSTFSIQANFEPLKQDSPCMTSPAKLLPKFNTDCKIYTPAFVLAVDESRYMQNEQIYHNLHIRKVAQISQQKAQLFVPRPSKNNSFCCICKIPFDDYLLHLRMQKHQILMRKSDSNFRINQLCTMFTKEHQTNPKKKRGRPRKSMKSKTISKMCILKKLIDKETGTEDSLKSASVSIQIAG